MTSVAIVRCGITLLEQDNPRFEGSYLLDLYILVHTLSFKPTRPCAFASSRSFGSGGFEWSDNKVVELDQNIRWEEVDLEFNLLNAL